MENFTINFAAAPLGAAFAGARSPWTSLSAVGTTHVRTQSPVPAVMSDTRKQNVLKTRINGGGYGAMGPHPEREPA